tara:strand:- start:422 stop:646 length:225 start_codon:yes stop_codon:yes gene_type:complete
MTQYRHIEATGRTDEVTVIEDPGMVTERADGTIRPDYAFIDPHTIRAHPQIIDALINQSERLWTLDEMLTELGT